MRPRRLLNLLFSILVTVPGGTFLLITRGVIDLIFLIRSRLSRGRGLLPRGTLQNGHIFVPEYFNLQFLHAINLDDLDICILYQNKIIVQRNIYKIIENFHILFHVIGRRSQFQPRWS